MHHYVLTYKKKLRNLMWFIPNIMVNYSCFFSVGEGRGGGGAEGSVFGLRFGRGVEGVPHPHLSPGVVVFC